MTIKQILTDLRAMLGDRKGATAIEYGLIAAAIAVVLIAVFATLGTDLQALFDEIGDELTITESG